MDRRSKGAKVVFLELSIMQPENELDYVERLEHIASGFHRAVFVRNEGIFAGKLL